MAAAFVTCEFYSIMCFYLHWDYVACIIIIIYNAYNTIMRVIYNIDDTSKIAHCT